VGMTESGYTGFMLSSYRPKSPLFDFTKTPSLINQLSLSWGVQAFFYDTEENIDAVIADLLNFLKARQLLNAGDIVVNTGSMPVKKHLSTNMIRISRVE